MKSSTITAIPLSAIRLPAIRLSAARRLRASERSSTQSACASDRRFPAAARRLAARGVALVGLLTNAAAFAQETTRPFAAPTQMTATAPSGVASLGQVTLALGLVLALIFGAAWVLRRVKGLGRNAAGALDIIADLPVGQKERAVLIRVGKQQLLIGVAPGRVTTLHVLTEPVEVAPPAGGSAIAGNTADRPNFKDLLMKSLGK
jgi:flagellar protein FliO/FliZ